MNNINTTNLIEIFDSSTHPTLDANWLNSRYDSKANFDLLVNDMQMYGIKKAFAIGMKNIGKYDENLFIEKVMHYEKFLMPVAYFDFFDFTSISELENYMKSLKKLGYVGIKLHPRFSDFNLANTKLEAIIKSANNYTLIPFLCTYFSDKKLNLRNNLIELMALLSKIENEKLILLHSGATLSLELINMAYVYQNVLFDLSFTLCKYEGSSLDLDIKYLFKNFDRRICIGSDFPEVSMKTLRERFEFFSAGLNIEKVRNIAFKNIENYLTF